MSERERLIEEVISAWRPRDLDGAPRGHPAFYDLDEEGRREAFEQARAARLLEAALDPEGKSSTVHRVLAQIRAARR